MRRPPHSGNATHRVHIESLVVEGLPFDRRHDEWLREALTTRLADVIGRQRPAIAPGDHVCLDPIRLRSDDTRGGLVRALGDRLGAAIAKGTGP